MPNPISYGYLEDPYLVGPYLTEKAGWATGLQVNRTTLDFEKPNGMEVERVVADYPKNSAMEIRRDLSIAHNTCVEHTYLEGEYLTGSYLARGYCASTGFEVDRMFVSYHGMQTNRIIYNTTNLRIMCDFPSRGTTGTNWTASSTAAGDFSVNNLNTDIVEQQWRSSGGITTVTLTCDTEIAQGISVDTIAILNHNLTSSAVVVVEASNSPTFSPVDDTFSMTWTETNMYYIAPEFPVSQYRYWRFQIADSTNPDLQLKIGTIVFGTTIILNGECFTDELTRRLRHFSDKVATDGFTNVSNDRALKTAVSFDFRFLQYSAGNYKRLRDVFEYSRTSLKCLWIPDPRENMIDRFTVFAKLERIPDEVHRVMGRNEADLISFSVDLDESL